MSVRLRPDACGSIPDCGIVERLWFENIDMKHNRSDAIQMTTAYRAYMGTTDGKAPMFLDIKLRDIRVNGAKRAASIEGLPEAPIQNLKFVEMSIDATKGFHAKFVNDIVVKDVLVTPLEAEAFEWEERRQIDLRRD
jgi:hypothetical protein